MAPKPLSFKLRDFLQKLTGLTLAAWECEELYYEPQALSPHLSSIENEACETFKVNRIFYLMLCKGYDFTEVCFAQQMARAQLLYSTMTALKGTPKNELFAACADALNQPYFGDNQKLADLVINNAKFKPHHIELLAAAFRGEATELDAFAVKQMGSELAKNVAIAQVMGVPVFYLYLYHRVSRTTYTCPAVMAGLSKAGRIEKYVHSESLYAQ